VGYVLEGVIGSEPVLRPSGEFAHAVMVPLAGGLCLLPMTGALFDEIRRGQPDAAGFPGCRLFPAGFEHTLAGWSKAGPVAYVEADYSGGTGMQSAIVWDGGGLVPGLVITADVAGDFRPGRSPISRALRRLGVAANGTVDEFDTIGLRRHRRTEDWRDGDR
jgi:hypothetical protein